MKRTEISLRVQIRTREGYDNVDLIDRETRITVPPGGNPVDSLRALMEQERGIVNAHLFQFPQQDLIEAPKEDEA